MPTLTDEERVALDPVGAKVYQVAEGLWEVACNSHATQLIGGRRHVPYLERRARRHNEIWHPHLRAAE